MQSHIGDLLVQAGLLKSEELAKAKEIQEQSGGLLATAILSLGVVSEQEFADLLSEHYAVPVVHLDDYEIEETTIQTVPYDLANKYGMIPIVKEQTVLTIAMVDPSNIVALNDVKFITNLDIHTVIALESDIKAKQDKYYEESSTFANIIDDINQEEVEVATPTEDTNIQIDTDASEDAPVVKLVNAILLDAIKKGASDIHLEPFEKFFRIRFRIDGVLYEIMKPPMKLKNAVTSRMKIMANLDIAEHRLPQDGRIKLKIAGNKEMDFRVNVLPTLFGEKVVLRLLDQSNLQLDMTKLGFFPQQLELFQDAINKPYGMLLVTGPTGSGKTTTLYSALSSLNKIGTNINTAEDPVEFNMVGVNQAQMHDDIGFNFAAALRAFLRQDPDIIMVGEIRDLETAEISIKASLTGHLVLSTLHTNDAPSTINRLLNMGVEPFLVVSSINAIVAQRLARRICPQCAHEIQVDPELLIKAGIPEEEVGNIKLLQGQGCDACAGTGYKGRIALYEIMPMYDEIKELILKGASDTKIKKECIRLGMLTLRASALIRLKEQMTTLEEVLRVTAAD